MRQLANSTIADKFEWGIEIECLLPISFAEDIGLVVGGYHYHDTFCPAPFPENWRCEEDCSIYTNNNYDTVACEIISPILQGKAGLRQVASVLDIIRGAGGYTNHTCGQHIHIGVRSVTQRDWRSDQCSEFIANMLQNTASHEHALWAVNGDCRRENSRAYVASAKRNTCLKESIKKIRKEITTYQQQEAEAQRFVLANSLPSVHTSVIATSALWDYGTLEFRVFDGTVNSDVALGRIQMVLALAEKSLRKCKARWEAMAHAKSYPGDFRGIRNLERFFILMGWSGEKYRVNRVPTACGWVLDTGEPLERIKAALRKQATEYDKKKPRGKRKDRKNGKHQN